MSINKNKNFMNQEHNSSNVLGSDIEYLKLINVLNKSEEEIKEFFLKQDISVINLYDFVLSIKNEKYLETIIKPFYNKHVNKLSIDEKCVLFSTCIKSLESVFYLQYVDEISFDLLDIVFGRKIVIESNVENKRIQLKTIRFIEFNNKKYEIKKNYENVLKDRVDYEVNCQNKKIKNFIYISSYKNLKIIYEYFFNYIEKDDLQILFKNDCFINFIASTFKIVNMECEVVELRILMFFQRRLSMN